MGNKSKKYRKKKTRNIVIIGLILLLIVSYFVSRNSKKIDPELIASIDVVEPTAHIRGSLESEIKLIEYSDYQCPACSAAELQIESLVDQYGEQFQLEFRHFPLRTIHPNAQLGAQAAEAAGMQGKFWEMHTLLFERQSEWSVSANPKRYLKEYAEEIGINGDRFVFDVESGAIKDIVNSQFDEAMSLELPGTPSFVFNGEKVDINTFIQENLIDEKNTLDVKDVK